MRNTDVVGKMFVTNAMVKLVKTTTSVLMYSSHKHKQGHKQSQGLSRVDERQDAFGPLSVLASIACPPRLHERQGCQYIHLQSSAPPILSIKE